MRTFMRMSLTALLVLLLLALPGCSAHKRSHHKKHHKRRHKHKHGRHHHHHKKGKHHHHKSKVQSKKSSKKPSKKNTTPTMPVPVAPVTLPCSDNGCSGVGQRCAANSDVDSFTPCCREGDVCAKRDAESAEYQCVTAAIAQSNRLPQLALWCEVCATADAVQAVSTLQHLAERCTA